MAFLLNSTALLPCSQVNICKVPTTSPDLGHVSTGYETNSVGNKALSPYLPLVAKFTKDDITSRGKRALLVLIFSLSWHQGIWRPRRVGPLQGPQREEVAQRFIFSILVPGVVVFPQGSCSKGIEG